LARSFRGFFASGPVVRLNIMGERKHVVKQGSSPQGSQKGIQRQGVPSNDALFDIL
jgi:hypothetical protein